MLGHTAVASAHITAGKINVAPAVVAAAGNLAFIAEVGVIDGAVGSTGVTAQAFPFARGNLVFKVGTHIQYAVLFAVAAGISHAVVGNVQFFAFDTIALLISKFIVGHAVKYTDVVGRTGGGIIALGVFKLPGIEREIGLVVAAGAANIVAVQGAMFEIGFVLGGGKQIGNHALVGKGALAGRILNTGKDRIAGMVTVFAAEIGEIGFVPRLNTQAAVSLLDQGIFAFGQQIAALRVFGNRFSGSIDHIGAAAGIGSRYRRILADTDLPRPFAGTVEIDIVMCFVVLGQRAAYIVITFATDINLPSHLAVNIVVDTRFVLH